MVTNVGTIEVIAKINTAQYKKGASEIDSANRQISDSGEKSSTQLNSALSRVAKVGLVAAAAGTAAFAAGLVKASKASWDQVAAVQQATVGLRAYEKDGNKVNAVLADLIKYARSDMGVLFNRKDLFQSAQLLKLNGVSTADLSKNVQILSRSVGLGLGNWQDLNAVVGRVVSTGRLSGIEFDQLTQYGFKLDKSLRNTNLSATELFKALDKGIPVDAMKGQATTIQGLGIRIESAFRGIGDAILGVDADTSQFIKGGLGDMIVGFMDKLPNALKSTQSSLSSATSYVIKTGRSVASYLGPSIVQLGSSITSRLVPAIKTFINSPFVQYLGGAFVFAVRSAIQILDFFVRSISSFISQTSQATGILAGLTAGYIACQVITTAAITGTNLLTAAQTRLNMAMRVNPIALLASGAIAIVTAYAAVVTSSDSNTAATDRLNAAQSRLRTAIDGVKTAEQQLHDARLAQEGTKLAVERAQLNYNKAVQQFGPKSLEAREAMHQLRVAEAENKKAADRVKDSVNGVTSAYKKRNEAAQAVRSESASIGRSVDSERSSWLGLGRSIDEARAKANKGPVRGGHIRVPTGFSIPGRASGGKVSANHPYLVGENRDGSINKTTELFIPNRSGMIMNSKDLQNALSMPSNIRVNSMDNNDSSPSVITKQFHIENLNIASDVDADRFLRKLNNNQEIESAGLTPQQQYMSGRT